MGKKGKKGKGSSGKKKGGKKGKKGKKGEQQMTWKEALLAYQINVKEKGLEDIRYEYRALEDQNMRHKERNERLKDERKQHMENLLKAAKELENKLAGETVVEKKAVIEVMMDQWEAGRQEERNIAELKEQVARKESEIVMEQRQVEYWQEYKSKGQLDHKTQIMLLEKELEDMQTSFDEMSGHLERTLEQTKDEIQKTTEDQLSKQKDLATEKAMYKMDKYSRQEVIDNDWLNKEADIHSTEVKEMIDVVEVLEKENLTIMSELFECHVGDLKISRNFYLTQFADDENLDETGILEMDLSQLTLNRNMLEDKKEEPIERPPSAMQLAIQHKVFSMPAGEEADDDSDFGGDYDDECSEVDDPFNNYFQFDDEDFDDYLKLGPLELKLLSIQGQKMPVFKPKTPPAEEMKAKDFKPDEWPVTQPMLRKSIKDPTPEKTPRSLRSK